MPKRADLQLRGSIRPEKIVLGHFTLTATGVRVSGRPSFDEFRNVLDFANHVEKASPWWVVGLLTYGEKRRDWKDLLEQIVDATGYSEGRVRNLKTVGEKVLPDVRRDDVEFSVHEVVAPLPREEQVEILQLAAEERLSVRDVKMVIRSRRRQAIVAGQAVLEGQFRVIYADPPWSYRSSMSSASAAKEHYPVMSIEEIIALPVEEHAYQHAVLFLWVPEPLVYMNPGPREVIEGWGFAHKSGFVWNKGEHNVGNYVSVQHEHLFICTRGSCTPEQLTPMLPSVQTYRRGEHSEKPEEFRKAIERLYPTGPHLELFGRKQVKGWKVFGNDARLWAKEMERAAS